MAKGLSLSIAYSANVGGIGSLTGTAPNVVMKGFSDILYENRNATSPVSFATWMQFGLPLSAIMVVIVWIWLQIFFLRCRGCCSCCEDSNEGKEDVRKRVKTVIRQEYKNLGPLNFAQGAVIFHFVLLAILWVTRDLGGIGGWGDIFPPKTVTDSTPSILISVSLFIFPSVLPTWLWRKHGML
ncbi:hypothetical protein KUTeg_009439 [Tegillarca granosa]|uniref:Uncharacterized protein n=1 Tax=Tegillarca granosa TaxID=220873 RepID=A0ABQ9F3V7_TEGGR|nr:hypothetical protein KUTeg_009439 [Tegillarca granosa]